MTKGVNNWSSTGGAILLVSLMLMSTWVNAIDVDNALEDEPEVRFSIQTESFTSDTQTNSSLPANTYGSAQNLFITDYPGFTDARMLANIPLTSPGGMPSAAIVSEATLDLSCRKIGFMATGGSYLYPALLLTDFDESNASHNLSDTGTAWNVSGANALGVDRNEWEPGAHASVSSRSTFTLNITALVQESLRNGQSNMSIIISGIGQPVFCASSEHPTTSERPSIEFTYTIGAAATQGSVNITGPEDGTILADPTALAIMPDLNPTVSFSNLSSSNLELQFSNSPEYRAISDGNWVWNSWDNPNAFSMTNGEFDTPNTNLTNGTWVHFRMRSVNNSILGPWVSGYFGLTAEIGDYNSQGRMEVVLRNDSVGLGLGTVHDTWVKSGNTSYNGDDDYRMRVGNSNNSSEGDMHAFFRVNMESIVIHDNVTVHDATLNIRRTDRTGEPMISAWLMDPATGMVFDELNFANSSQGNTWVDGGRDDVTEYGILGTLNGNQTYSTLTFDATSIIQEYLYAGHTGDLDFVLQAVGIAGEEIEIATGDEPFSYRPHLDIEYTWGDGTATPSPADVKPASESAAWDLVNWALQSTTTPTLSWDASAASQSGGTPADVLIELVKSPDGLGSSIPLRADSRTDNGFNLSAGEYTVPSSWGLDFARTYIWRIQMIEDDERGPFNNAALFISQINSTGLGGGEHELRYTHGNGTTNEPGLQLPSCSDLTLESGGASGTNLDGQDLTASTTQVVLVGCDLSSHALPDGLAVISATLRLRTHQYSGLMTFAIPMTVHESAEHAWGETTANWNTTNGTRLWNGLGASGSERVQALDATDVRYDSTWYEWNVTAAVQSSMRAGSLIDFILTSAHTSPVTFYDRSSNYKPELVIVYTNGSNAAPSVASGLTPGNGDWILSGDVQFAVDQTPTLSWNGTSTPPANGWEVQVDGDSNFGSSALLSFASWIDTSAFNGFNFTIPNSLSAGETFHWRVRGISASGQIGLWSAGTNFVVPSISVSQNDTNTYTVDLGHGTVLADASMPLFEDTWVTGWVPDRNDTHGDETTLYLSGSGPSNALFRFPIDGAGALPHPSGGRLIGANIEIYVYDTNNSGPRLSVHEVLVPWTADDATGMIYNATTNWSAAAGGGSLDRSELVDVTSSLSSGNRYSLDFTEIAQGAIARGDTHVSLMLSVDAGSQQHLVIGSVDNLFGANRPTVQLTWRNGSGTSPTVAGTLTGPTDGSIQWDPTTHAMISEDRPTLSWTHPNSANISDWRVFVYDEQLGIRAGYEIADSRTDSGFDLTNLTWRQATSFSVNEEYRWFVQPIDDDMLGPRSVSRTFIVPTDLGDETNSTDAWTRISNGNAHKDSGSFDMTEALYIDSCTSNSNYGSSNVGMMVGRSNGGPSCGQHESRSLIRFDISNIPIHNNDPWQVITASVNLYRYGGSSTYDTDVSISNVRCDWAQYSVTWNSCYTNNTWQNGGAGGANDADMPTSTTNVSGNGWYSWDVTNLLQQARMDGSDTLNLLLRSEDPNLNARHAFVDEHDNSLFNGRPLLSFDTRSGSQTVPADPVVTSPSPGTAHTMWDTTAMRPTPIDPMSISWTHSAPGDIDAWQLQGSLDSRFSAEDSTWLYDSSDSGSYNGTFNLANLTYTNPSNVDFGDNWMFSRIRAVEDGRYSNWSEAGPFRVPDEQGSDDGAGNYTVTMSRGKVFVDTGVLPSMPDTWIGSNTIGQYQNHGSTSTIAVGVDPSSSAHDAVGLVEVDLAEYPYPATMLPTAVTLRMYVASITGSGAHSISIHDCASWSESTVTWSSFNPNTQCNSTASSSMTSTSTTSGVWYEWDVTGLARSAWAGTGVMSMALMTSWTGTIDLTSADGSTTYGPQLILEYVDNPNGATPPNQVSLVWPDHLGVVYGEDASNPYILDVDPRPDLAWDSLSDATGYILRLSNASGTQTYKSWESANNTAPAGFNIGSTASTWTPDFDMAAGEIYTWSVQALNNSVPGARSVPWTFGVGDPTMTNEGNHVYSTLLREGNDVPTLNHFPIDDTHISEGAVNSASGSDSLEIGIGCDNGLSNYTYRCYGLYQIDMSQMPIHDDMNPHSATLSVYVNGITEYAVANYMDLTAYAVLNPYYEENGATWNSAATGVNWAAPGLQPGIDRGTIPLDSVRIPNTYIGGWIQFDIGGAMTSINGTVTVVIVPTVNTGHMLISLDHSEDTDLAMRPMIQFNTTVVDSIAVSGPSTTDADTSVSFTGTLRDVNTNALAGDVAWSSSSGMIDPFGVFTPNLVGVVMITASYGQVSTSVNITVGAGAPVQLVVVPLASSLTADEVFDMTVFEVIDMNGNAVPGETITMTITNGTISPGLAVTTPVTGVSWVPWTSGQQYINVTWGAQTVSVMLTVNVGVPDYFVITGANTIEAGNTTTLDFNVFDHRDNAVPQAAAGTWIWGASNGAMDNATGAFTGDAFGDQTVWVESLDGIRAEHTMTVTYGDITDMEITAVGPENTIIVTSEPTAESIAMTADESVTFNIIRIDVQGNREVVDLPAEAWIWSNGTLAVGPPTVWNAWENGPQWVRATLEGVEVLLPMAVDHGIPVLVEARTTDLLLVSGDPSAVLNAYAADADGNQWSIAADSWVITTAGADSTWLQGIGSWAQFEPIMVGDWTVRLLYTYTDELGGQTSHYDDVTFTVAPGGLRYITVAADASITADDTHDLQPGATDHHGNLLSVDDLLWYQWDAQSGNVPATCSDSQSDWVNITASTRDSGYLWDATTVGEYTVCAIGEPGTAALASMTTITVAVGVPASVWHMAYATADERDPPDNMTETSITAGELPSVQFWVADADGNPYRLAVNSIIDDAAAELESLLTTGDYRFIGTKNRTYTIDYDVGVCTACAGSWTVHVGYADLFTVIPVASASGGTPSAVLTVNQQTTVTITVTGVDQFGNPVPVTITNLWFEEEGGELNTATQIDDTTYEVYMLNEGINTIHIEDGVEGETVEVTVGGTIPGFFEANSPWSWVGLGFIVFMIIGLVLVVGILMRRGDRDDEEYEDDYDEGYEDDGDEEYEMPTASAREQEFSAPAAEASSEDYDIESDPNYRVDEDGTEWWQDDEGVWWYRDPGMEDWAEWVD